MSMTMMAEVHAHSQAKGSARSVLLTLAFYARDDGTHAFPSMQRMADDTGLSVRHIQRLILALEEDGHIRVFRDKSVRKRPRNFYHVLRPWHTAQMIMDKGQKEPAQMIIDTMSMDLKPNTSERKTRTRTPEDEEAKPPVPSPHFSQGQAHRFLIDILAMSRTSDHYDICLAGLIGDTTEGSNEGDTRDRRDTGDCSDRHDMGDTLEQRSRYSIF
jgi:hypothetical protein